MDGPQPKTVEVRRNPGGRAVIRVEDLESFKRRGWTPVEESPKPKKKVKKA